MSKPRDFLKEHLDAEQTRLREEAAKVRARKEHAWFRGLLRDITADPFAFAIVMLFIYIYTTFF